MSSHSGERPGSPVFRRAFVGSVALTTSCVLLAGAFGATKLETAASWAHYLLGLAATAVLYHLISKLVARRAGFLVAPSGVTAGGALLSIILWGIPVYVAFAILIGVAAYVFISRDDHYWPLTVMGLAMWGPLLLVGPLAALIAWSRSQR